MNKTIDKATIGKYMIAIGIILLLPIIADFYEPSELVYRSYFFEAATISVLAGASVLSYAHFKNDPDAFSWHIRLCMNSLTVIIIWLWGIFIGALPFVFSGQLGFVQALFEATSGWTTTGFSLMGSDVMPAIFLLHRAIMQYVGGLGFVMVMILFLPGREAMSLFSGEGHPDRLMPSLKRTAWIVFLIYNGFAVFGTLLYCLSGLSVFDAACHTMSAISTGGFSTRPDSIGGYNNLGVELVSAFLMTVGMTNFYVLLQLFRFSWREALKVSEFRLMFAIIGLFFAILTFTQFPVHLAKGGEIFAAVGASMREAIFLTTSALSGTGYGTSSPADWSRLTVFFLMPLMFIGGMTGSTAGGLKISRVYVLLRILRLYFRRRLAPQSTVIVPHYFRVEGRVAFDRNLVDEAMGYTLVYLATFAATMLLIMITANAEFTAAFFEAASAVGNVGISIGLTSPETNAATLLVEIAAMILGRLEIFIVLVGFSSAFQAWKNR